MKAHTYALWMAFCGTTLMASAQSLTLQPGTAGKDATLHSTASTTNYGSHPDFYASAWTAGGTPFVVRNLIEFDYSALPAGAVVTSAYLSLYSYNSPSNGPHSTLSGSNASTISRVTSAWAENTVTWNTQPSVTTTNQVTLAASTSTIQDYLNIDVTNMVLDQLSGGNNGFMLQLANENYYRRMMFGSSDNTNAALHPKLVINYYTCRSLQPDATAGKDATLHSTSSTTNFGSHPDFYASAWTAGGTPFVVRNLVEFDLSAIPSGSTILSSDLSLYSYNSPSNGPHSTLSGSNASTISRVTSAWAENTVTWNTQPSTTTTNQITLAASTSTIQDYLANNVTALVQDMVNTNNYGFMIQLVTESYYRRMMFGSSDNTNSALRPKLNVCWSEPSPLPIMPAPAATLADDVLPDFTLYPNPAHDNVTVVFASRESIKGVQLQLVSSQGKLLSEMKPGAVSVEMSLAGHPKGLYFVRAIANGKATTHKLVIE